MKNKSFLFVASFVFLLALGSFEQVSACTCSKDASPRTAFGKAKAVFVGKAVGATKQYKSAYGEKEIVYDIAEISFEVEEAFKGVKKGSRVTIHSGGDGDLCGYMFEHGATYLVYGYGGGKESFSTDICTRTSEISKAEEDLKFLRRLPPEKSGAKILGLTVNSTQNSKIKYKAETDSPGNYKIKRIFNVQNDGLISGKVIDADGNPVENVLVVLLTADELAGDKGYLDSFSTNEDGSFTFKMLPFDTYYLAVNFAYVPYKEFPYPETFYPSASKSSGAVPLRIEKNKNVTGIIFQLPPPLVERKIYGSILWEDGSPAAEMELELYLEDTENLEACVNECTVQTDAQGKVILTGYTGRSYRIISSGPKITGETGKKPFPEIFTIKAGEELPNFKKVFRQVEGTTGILE